MHTSKVILSPGIPVDVHECLGLSHYRSGHALGDVSTNLFVHSLPPLHAHTTHTHIHTHTHDYTLSWGRLPFTLQYKRNMRILLTNCWRPMLTQTCQWRWSTHTSHELTQYCIGRLFIVYMLCLWWSGCGYLIYVLDSTRKNLTCSSYWHPLLLVSSDPHYDQCCFSIGFVLLV